MYHCLRKPELSCPIGPDVRKTTEAIPSESCAKLAHDFVTSVKNYADRLEEHSKNNHVLRHAKALERNQHGPLVF
jgi:hypothetical protein